MSVRIRVISYILKETRYGENTNDKDSVWNRRHLVSSLADSRDENLEFQKYVFCIRIFRILL